MAEKNSRPAPPNRPSDKELKIKNPNNSRVDSRNMAAAHEGRRKKSRDSYRAGMYDPEAEEQKWYTSRDIERRCDKCMTGSYDALQNLVRDGFLEKRPAGGEAYNRRKGWEYRWVKGK